MVEPWEPEPAKSNRRRSQTSPNSPAFRNRRSHEPLTTINYAADKVSDLAIDRLLSLIADVGQPPQVTLIEPELVIRRARAAAKTVAEPNFFVIGRLRIHSTFMFWPQNSGLSAGMGN